MNAEKTAKPRKWQAVLLGVLVVICSGGFFPVVNFNPDNPVQLGQLMRFVIVLMALMLCAQLGVLLAVWMPQQKIRYIILIGLAAGVLGLAARFLLEFGEVSNTYNFTVKNVLFHLFLFGTVPAVAFIGKREGPIR